MRRLSALIACALLCACGRNIARATSPEEPAGAIGFRIHLTDMAGLQWRKSTHNQLTPVCRRGTATAWTADRAVLEAIREAAGEVITAPTVCAHPDAPVHVESLASKSYVGDLKRVADGPPGKNTSVAFVPEVAKVSEGFGVDLSGHVEKGGIRARVDVSHAKVTAMHACAIADSVTNPETQEVRPVDAQIQVPEVLSTRLGGEWLIPEGSVLVVSLGAYTATDAQGKPEVCERLAVIEPNASDEDKARAEATPAAALAVIPAPPMPIGPSMLLPLASPSVAPRPVWRESLEITARAAASRSSRPEIALLTLPLLASPLHGIALDLEVRAGGEAARPTMPAVPSRGLPTPIAADGTVVALPPLPDPEVLATSADEDDTPRPAPQGHPIAVPPTHASPALAALPRVTRFEARGNTMVVRDREAGTCKLICDDLVLYPAPGAPPVVGTECAEDDPDALKVVLNPKVDTRTPSPLARSAAYASPGDDDANSEETPSLNLELFSAKGTTQYAGEVNLQAIAREPVVLRVPMPDGSVVEVTARLVKKAPK